MLSGGREARGPDKDNPGKTKVLHWPGHVSLLIDDHWVGRYDNSMTTYVSWWPSGENRQLTKSEKLESGIAGMRVADAGPKNHFVADMLGEKYLPDNIVRLTATAGQQLQMMAAWASIRTEANASYRPLYHNCSTIVAQVLQAAGFNSGKWSFWTDHSMVWTPNKVLKFAMAAGGTGMTWAELYTELQGAGLNYSHWGNQRRARDNRYCKSGVDCVNTYPT
jgi:hypothetical protein